MRKTLVAALGLVMAGAVVSAQETYTEPKSGTSFQVHRDGMTLLGAGLRVKKILFTFKAYAVGFYVDDAALSGPLAAFKGKGVTPALYQELATGDFRKELVLKFLRNLSEGRIQGAMRESLEGADPKILDQFVAYFPEIKDGQQCTLRWMPGGTLESIMAGQERPPIANKAFTERLFGLYLGEHPLQDDIKAGLVARVPEVLK